MRQFEKTRNVRTPHPVFNIDVQSWDGPWVPLTKVLHQPHGALSSKLNRGSGVLVVGDIMRQQLGGARFPPSTEALDCSLQPKRVWQCRKSRRKLQRMKRSSRAWNGPKGEAVAVSVPASILQYAPASLQESFGDRRERACTEGPRSSQGRSPKH